MTPPYRVSVYEMKKKTKKTKKNPQSGREMKNWQHWSSWFQLSQLVACIPSAQAKKALLSCLSCFRLDLQQPPKAGVTHLLLRQKRHHQQTLITPSVTVGHYAWLWVHLQKYINNQDTNTGRIPRSLNCRVICVGRKSMGKRRYGDPGLGDLIGTEGAHGRKRKETGSVLWAEHCASQGCTLKSLPGPSVKWARLQGDRLQTAPLPRD